MGGLLGGLFGGFALAINLSVFRTQQNTLLKYLITGVISVAALILYLVAAVALTLFLNN
jgi:hypothetical protein